MSYNVPNVKFNDGQSIPQLGYGVWQVEDKVAEKVVGTALETGYRHIDTAAIYGNEAGVGRAIANSSVAREDIFLTTKLWNSDQGYESAFEAFEASLEKLGTDYVDLYLIHPYFSQEALRAVHAEYGIVTQAWSPLGNGSDLLQNPVLAEIAERHGATPAQVVLAWHLAKGTVAIPKSVTPSRIEENLASVNVKLTAEDIAAVDALSSPEGRIGADPANIDF